MKLAGITSGIKLGLWISPEGQAIPVDVSHVTDIINNPTKFGLSQSLSKVFLINIKSLCTWKVRLGKN